VGWLYEDIKGLKAGRTQLRARVANFLIPPVEKLMREREVLKFDIESKKKHPAVSHFMGWDDDAWEKARESKNATVGFVKGSLLQATQLLDLLTEYEH